MFAGLHGRQRHLGVQPAGSANAHDIHVGPVEQPAKVSVSLRAVIVGETLRPSLDYVRHRDQARLR